MGDCSLCECINTRTKRSAYFSNHLKENEDEETQMNILTKG